jgi:hypothetical protein
MRECPNSEENGERKKKKGADERDPLKLKTNDRDRLR